VEEDHDLHCPPQQPDLNDYDPDQIPKEVGVEEKMAAAAANYDDPDEVEHCTYSGPTGYFDGYSSMDGHVVVEWDLSRADRLDHAEPVRQVDFVQHVADEEAVAVGDPAQSEDKNSLDRTFKSSASRLPKSNHCSRDWKGGN
jgi:hypothetical protein